MTEQFLFNLPALIIVLPILAAPILAVFGGKSEITRWASWLITFLIAGITFSCSSYIFIDVVKFGGTSYYFGNWAAPVGIEYEITGINSLFLLLITGLAFISLPFALESIEKEIPSMNQMTLLNDNYD